MSESQLQREIMLAVTATGGRVFRNNIGQWEYAPGRFVKYGVCNPGGADLIGWTATGRFLGIEVKNPGRDMTKAKRKEDQGRFRDAVNRAGGLCIIARSVQEVLDVLKNSV